MKKNSVFKLFAGTFFVLFLLLLAACSGGMTERYKGGKVSFCLKKAQIQELLEEKGIAASSTDSSRAIQMPGLPDGQKIFFTVSLLGDYEQSQTAEVKGDIEIIFEEVPIGASIYAQVKLYISTDEGKTSYLTIFQGVSDPITVQEEIENTLEIKKLENAVEGFVLVLGGTKGYVAGSNVFIKGRSIDFTDFYIGANQVTEKEYSSIMDTGSSSNNVVTRVSWFDAIEYCNRLSLKENLTPCYTLDGVKEPDKWINRENCSVSCSFKANGYRLPTEAEWEYVARGGKDGNLSGVKSLSDGIREWCWDWSDTITKTTFATGASSSPRGNRVNRGDTEAYTVNRYYNQPGYTSEVPLVGFRVVRTIGVSDMVLSYVVTFKTNCSATIDNIILKEGGTFDEPDTSAFEKTGYKFSGWYTAESQKTPYDFAIPVAHDIALEAVWTPIKYTISFDKGQSSSEEMAPVTAEYDSKVVLPKITYEAPAGMKFGGWALTADAEDWTYEDGAEVLNLTAKDEDEVVLYALWLDKDVCSITYVIDDYDTSSLSPKTFLPSKNITLPSAENITGYTFGGWYLDSEYSDESKITGWSAGEKTSSITVYAKWIPNSDTAYKVEHYKQNLNGVGYTIVTADTESKTGTTDAQTNAAAKTYEGFTVQDIKQTTINADGSSVVKIYYNRNKATYTFKAGEGTWSDGETEKSVTGFYGAKVTAPASPEKKNYNFSDWDPSVPSSFGTENITFVAQYSQASAGYTVEHYQQNCEAVDVSEKTYTLKETESDKKGNCGELTQAVAKEYEGFEKPTVTQETITADGKTVIKIYYDRIKATYTFKSGEGSWADGTTEKTVTGLYGATVTAPDSPEKENYDFDVWDPAVPVYFGTENMEFVAQYTQALAGYTVEHYQQNCEAVDVTEKTYTLKETESDKKGTCGELTQAVAKEYEGFEKPTVTQETIAADGSTVVKIYYDRKQIQYTFDPDGGNWNDDTTPVVLKGLYGTTVTKPKGPDKAGYLFTEWDSSIPDTFGTTSITFTAIWELSTGTPYKVEHYQQNLDDDEQYTLKETTNKQGTTGDTTAAEQKTYEGFTSKTFKQDTIAADGSTVIKIYYDRNTITYTFAGNQGGWGTQETKTFSAKFDADFDSTAVTGPSRDGYDFDGWDAALPETFGAQDKTFNATWKVIEYQITYYSEGQNITSTADCSSFTKTFTIESEDISLTSFKLTKEGAVFLGWYDNPECTGSAQTSIPSGAIGSKPLYAKWNYQKGISVTIQSGSWSSDATSADFKLTYGGSDVAEGQTLTASGNSITLTATSLAGYTYTWKVDGSTTDSSDTAYSSTNALTISTTSWKKGVYDIVVTATDGTNYKSCFVQVKVGY